MGLLSFGHKNYLRSSPIEDVLLGLEFFNRYLTVVSNHSNFWMSPEEPSSEVTATPLAQPLICGFRRTPPSQ